MTTRPDWLGAGEALDRILAACQRLPAERLDLVEDAGDLDPTRALAEPVHARVDHPPWDNSAMDGFAVHADDVADATPDNPVTLPVASSIAAGSFPSSPLRRGTAVRVMTGAAVPDGATGVVRVEHTDGADRRDVVLVHRASDARRNIRRRGEDIREGSPVAAKGTELSPALVGALAMQGVRSVPVRRRPRVGILANGDELASFDEVDDVLARRRLMNSNSHALAAQVRAAGGVPVDLGIAADTVDAIAERLRAAEACDAVVSTAGVSVGDHDAVKAALLEAGLRDAFWRLRIRPGSPMTFGRLQTRPFWGLPGNPVSALVTFEVFVRPALRKMAGHTRLHRARLVAEAAETIRSPGGLTHYYRASLTWVEGGPPRVSLTGPQGSGLLSSMLAADALAVVGEDTTEIPRGEPVTVLLLDGPNTVGAM